jgi:hypothetical protein
VKFYLNYLICPQDTTLNIVCISMYTNTYSHTNLCICTYTCAHTYTHTVRISGIYFTLGVRIA